VTDHRFEHDVTELNANAVGDHQHGHAAKVLGSKQKLQGFPERHLGFLFLGLFDDLPLAWQIDLGKVFSVNVVRTKHPNATAPD
jgi:hypothetical protein